jgi:hypothetical protein
VNPEIGTVDLKVVFPTDNFVFGQYKILNVRIENVTDLPIDELYIINNNPLATGFFIKKIASVQGRAVIEQNLIIRATVLKKHDRVDFLLVSHTNGFLRIIKFDFEFRISNSFKTKCMLEKIGNDNKFLVGIDIFDAKDNNINALFFCINSLVLLSNKYIINTENYPLTNVNNNFLISQNLIYFELLPNQAKFARNIPRTEKDIFYDLSNILRLDYSSEIIKKEKYKVTGSEVVVHVSDQEKENNLIGLLKEESRAVRQEFSHLQSKIKEKFSQDIKFTCDEFLDFELLWGYKNIGLFGREATIFSPENDRDIQGIHSIISTPINLVSYRYKKSKPVTNPIYSISVKCDPLFRHNFSSGK